jgi:hypothetical protein
MNGDVSTAKEKAKSANDAGGGDFSNFTLESVTSGTSANLSTFFSMSDSHGISLNLTTLQPFLDVAMAVQHMHSKGSSWIIDSGTTSPIHRNHPDFLTITPESGTVSGFNQTTRAMVLSDSL